MQLMHTDVPGVQLMHTDVPGACTDVHVPGVSTCRCMHSDIPGVNTGEYNKLGEHTGYYACTCVLHMYRVYAASYVRVEGLVW